MLERTPREGQETSTQGIWCIRRWVLRGVLLLQVYYRIDDADQVVELLSVRTVNLTSM